MTNSYSSSNSNSVTGMYTGAKFFERKTVNGRKRDLEHS